MEFSPPANQEILFLAMSCKSSPDDRYDYILTPHVLTLSRLNTFNQLISGPVHRLIRE